MNNLKMLTDQEEWIILMTMTTPATNITLTCQLHLQFRFQKVINIKAKKYCFVKMVLVLVEIETFLCV